MSEFAKRCNRLLDQSLGVIGVTLTDMMLGRVLYQGQENIKRTNKRLGEGRSVLLVSDHPGTLETIYTAGLVPRHLSHRQEAGVLLKDAFVNGKMGLLGRMAVDILDWHAVEALDVKTPKHEPDKGIRIRYNFQPTRRCLEILGKPGGLLLTFASGTRSQKMLEAEKGLGYFSSKADWVVPLTTVTDGKNKPIVVVCESLPGKIGVGWCTRQFGKETGRQVFSDLVMSVIASGQPDKEKRGFYGEQAGQLERYMENPTGIIPRPEDPRSRRVIEAYIAWKSRGFEEI